MRIISPHTPSPENVNGRDTLALFCCDPTYQLTPPSIQHHQWGFIAFYLCFSMHFHYACQDVFKTCRHPRPIVFALSVCIVRVVIGAECHHKPHSDGHPIITLLIVCNCAETFWRDGSIREIVNNLQRIWYDICISQWLICVTRLMNWGKWWGR
jgi:hypothetical protein